MLLRKGQLEIGGHQFAAAGTSDPCEGDSRTVACLYHWTGFRRDAAFDILY
jgi:hypothetical protein